jgi:thiol-disulfide isomerase/thioredoxin
MFFTALLLALVARAGIVEDVRALIAQKDFARADREVQLYRQVRGPTPELALAISWLGRGALAAKNLDRADTYASQARQMAMQTLAGRKLATVPDLVTAVGAAIEVHGQALHARGETGAAVAYLRSELKSFTSPIDLRERIAKNINLLSLEGKPAPELEAKVWLGPKPRPLAALRGRPVLMFFWAHWCPDCKAEAPVIARLMKTYGPKGLALVGPTRYYGYVAGGEDALPEVEKPYIEKIRRQYYAVLADMPVPLSNANFTAYGASSTPTIALIDAAGIVRFYHPGTVTEQELSARIEAVMR